MDIYKSADSNEHCASIYQGRINENLNNEEDIFDELGAGKVYYCDSADVLDCINSILKF